MIDESVSPCVNQIGNVVSIEVATIDMGAIGSVGGRVTKREVAVAKQDRCIGERGTECEIILAITVKVVDDIGMDRRIMPNETGVEDCGLAK